MAVGDRVKVVGDSPWWSHEGEIVDIKDGFANVRFICMNSVKISAIWIGYLRAA